MYRNGQLIGAIGISGDGVDQDDIVGASGTHDFLAPFAIRADQFAYLGARLPYAKFPRDPDGTDGSVEEPPFSVAAEKLANISTRVSAGTGDNRLIGGFIISGTAPKKVIVRAMGPSLGQFGVSSALADPTLELRNAAGGILATNDNWADSQESEINATAIAPTHDLESAIIRTLPPGAYTALVDGKSGETGTALVEVYDLSPASEFDSGKYQHARRRRSAERRHDRRLHRQRHHREHARPRPDRCAFARVRRHHRRHARSDPRAARRQWPLIAANDNWREGPEVEIQESKLAPANDLESAIITTLPSGPYTAVIHERNGASGIGLFEVYNLAESLSSAGRCSHGAMSPCLSICDLTSARACRYSIGELASSVARAA